MTVRYLALVRGKGMILTASDVCALMNQKPSPGLILVYYRVVEGDNLRNMTDDEARVLPFRECFLELRYSFDHPAQQGDELFLGNFRPKEDKFLFANLPWKPRFVDKALKSDGQPIKSKGYAAAFAKLQDLFPTLRWTL
jgi:hypothetical protein